MSTEIRRRLHIAFTDRAYRDGRVLFPWAEQLLGSYKKLGKCSSSVEICDDPEIAEFILFVDGHVIRDVDYESELRKTSLFRAYRSKTFVYNERDNPSGGLPGLYVSMPKPLFAPGYMRAVPYMHYEIDKIDVGSYWDLPRDKFAIFMGDASTAPVRSRLFRLGESCINMRDTSRLGVHDYTDRRKSQEELNLYLHQYCAAVGSSVYSVCPRGHGSSSIRLFESLMLGAIPVILSDDFMSPFLSSDSEFLLHVPESQTRLLCSKLSRDKESITVQQERCKVIVQRMVLPAVRLDYIVTQLDSIMNHSCNFMETQTEKIRRIIYWKIRLMKKKCNVV